MVESIRAIKGVQSIERRYYLFSFALDVRRVADAVHNPRGEEKGWQFLQ